jgi:hypothetical protein
MSAIWGAVGAGLLLIAEQAAVSGKGPNELSGGLKVLDGALQRLLDPTVPLIPDRRTPAATSNNPAPNPKGQWKPSGLGAL